MEKLASADGITPTVEMFAWTPTMEMFAKKVLDPHEKIVHSDSNNQGEPYDGKAH